MKKIIIFAAPSGSGKTTIVKRLLEECPKLSFSISATTRAPRINEQNGIDYHFITIDTFQEKIDNQEFLEWEMVYEGKYYGTLKSEIERIYSLHQYPILDIDVVGAVNLKKQFANQVFAIFIKAPSVAELERRLFNRDTDTAEIIRERIAKAEEELSYEPNFDISVINEDLDTAIADVKKVLANQFGPDILQ